MDLLSPLFRSVVMEAKADKKKDDDKKKKPEEDDDTKTDEEDENGDDNPVFISITEASAP